MCKYNIILIICYGAYCVIQYLTERPIIASFVFLTLQVRGCEWDSLGGIAALQNNSVILESRHLIGIWAAYYVDDRYHVLALARRKDDIAARKAHSSSVHTTV